MQFKFFDKDKKKNDPDQDEGRFDGSDVKQTQVKTNLQAESKMIDPKTNPVDSMAKKESDFRIGAAINQPPIREGGITVLGKDISFSGDLRGAGSVKIDGTFKGTINLEKELTILKNGNVEADIEADIVTIDGNLVGNVIGRSKVIINDEGKLVGDIKTEKIAVEEGAVVKGKIEITKGKAGKVPPPKTDAPKNNELKKEPVLTDPTVKKPPLPGPDLNQGPHVKRP